MYSSYTIPPFYDPLVAKLIAWGRDRDEAIARMRRALDEYGIGGIKTNIPFHRAGMGNGRFLRGDLGTHFVERETTLLEDMRKVVEEGRTVGDQLSHLEDDRKRVAAMAAVTAMIGGIDE